MKVDDPTRNLKTRDELIAHFKESTFSSLTPAMIGWEKTIIAVNPAFVRAMAAVSENELVGLNTDNFYPDAQPSGLTSENFRDKIRASIIDHGFHRYSTFMKRFDDRPVLAEVTSFLIPYQGGSVIHHTLTRVQVPDDVEFRSRSTEEVMREIVRKSKDKTALMIDRELVEMSNPMLRMFGFESSKDIPPFTAGMFSPEFQPDGQRSSEGIAEVIKAATEHGDQRHSWVICDGDGAEREIESHVTSMSLGGRQAFKITFYDHAGETLARMAAERMLTALDANSDGLMLISLANAQIVECNRVAHEMLGYTKGELLQMRVPDFVPEDYRVRNRQHLAKLKEGEVLPIFESMHCSKSGERIPVLISATTIDIEGERFALGSVRDLREELKLRNATEDLREQFESVGKLLPVGVFIQSADAANIYVNDAWTRITGLSREAALGDGWKQVLPEEDREQIVKKGLDELAETGVSGGRYRLMRTGGEIVWVEHKSVMLQLSDGSETILGILQDVTETERRQREIEEARRRAEEANKAKTTFLSHMSHELRTPLNAVLGFTQVLQMELLTPSQKESLGHIEQGGILLLRHIEDLLDLSRIEQGQLDLLVMDCEAAPLIEGVVQLVQKIADSADVRMIAEDMDRSIVVKVDEHRFKQVILNLLSNAIKYNHKGGQIEVRLDRFENQARVEIEDTGRGIPQNQQKNLFKPFNRLGAENTSVQGLGIGLALAQELTNHMDGTIKAESEEGVGTTMTVLLPLS